MNFILLPTSFKVLEIEPDDIKARRIAATNLVDVSVLNRDQSRMHPSGTVQRWQGFPLLSFQVKPKAHLLTWRLRIQSHFNPCAAALPSCHNDCTSYHYCGVIH